MSNADAAVKSREPTQRLEAPPEPAPARAAERGMTESNTVIWVRPICPADKNGLVKAFGRPVDDLRDRRLADSAATLTEFVLAYLTEVDHRDRSALVALEPSDGRVIGIARYVGCSDVAATAEIVVAVVDEWQGRGVGRELLALLVERAASAGFERLSASVSPDNRRVLRLLTSHGFRTAGVDARSGVLELELALASLSDRLT